MERQRYFVDPIDVLFLRGNKLFGDAGSFGESLMPPWPSVAAGAIRSALLAARGHDTAAFARGEITSDAELGTPSSPGTFTVTAFDVARRFACGSVETLHPLPADLAIQTIEADGGAEPVARHLTPSESTDGIGSSAATARLAVLTAPRRGKPASARLLNADGWNAYLSGGRIDVQDHLVPIADLWRIDTRTGIALDPVQRRAAEGALFASQGIAPRKRDHAPAAHDRRPDPVRFDVGFLAEVAGAALPNVLTLRFGGDGRAAIASGVDYPLLRGVDESFTHDAIVHAKRCRFVLTTPGLFTGGWRPTGVDDSNGDPRFQLHGVTGRLVCAAVPRAEVVSGFDLARWRPKAAQRVAPAGSVYWLDDLQATPDGLRKLENRGLWSDPVENDSRRAEGFNRFRFAAWRD